MLAPGTALAPGAELAPAKVNLTLHVTGRRADGYHLLDSLVVFPRLGDVIEAEPARGMSLTLGGPFGQDLDAGGDNLVLRAAALLRRQGQGAALRLIKSLPVASGIGGGSSDAAATLRLLSRLWRGPPPQAQAVLALGADVPACLGAVSCRMRGIGERIVAASLPPFWIVLANPGAPLSTEAVFRGLDGRFGAAMPELPLLRSCAELCRFVAAQRNDLEPAAVAVAPAVAETLAALGAQPGCGAARMSGSGATCFGVFPAETAALAASAALRRARPGWWVAAAPVG